MHRILVTRGRVRALFLASLAAVAVASLLLKPVASAQPIAPADPQEEGATTQEGAAGAQGKDKEEDGGNIVFHVVDRKQKYSVLYKHEAHLGAGIKCDECHTKIFEKKLGANKFRMKDVTQGKFCGACHTDKPAADIQHAAFPPKKNCQKCHDVRVRDEK